MRNHHQKQDAKERRELQTQKERFVQRLKLCKYHLFESLILAQDERWRRA